MAELVARWGVLMGGGLYEDVTKQLSQQAAEWQIASNERAEADRAMYHASVEALKQRHAEILEIERLRGEQAVKDALEPYERQIETLRKEKDKWFWEAEKFRKEAAEEYVRGFQSVALERRNWEFFKDQSVATINGLEERCHKLEAYREAEKERIEAAVREEREACAKIADAWFTSSMGQRKQHEAYAWRLAGELIRGRAGISMPCEGCGFWPYECKCKASTTDSRTEAADPPPVSEPRPYSFVVGQF